MTCFGGLFNQIGFCQLQCVQETGDENGSKTQSTHAGQKILHGHVVGQSMPSWEHWHLEKGLSPRHGMHEGSSNDGNSNYGDHVGPTKHGHVVHLI